MDKYVAQGATTQAAIEEGLQKLGISREEAIIDIQSEGRKGFLGIGQKDAIVTVRRKESNKFNQVLAEATDLSMDKSVKEVPTNESLSATVSTEAMDEPVQSEDESLFEKTEATNEEHEMTAPESAEVAEVASEDTAYDEDDPEENQEDQEAIQHVHDYLKRVIQAMGIDDATVELSQDSEQVLFDITTEDAGLVIGRHGKVLNGLQRLAQIQLHQHADNKLYVRVDAENYRSRRRGTVQHLAEKTANKVKQTNQPVILEPMPAHERKQIHRYLHHHSGVKTHSEGKEPNRYLVVEPTK
ncbi:RNA-binding cell elongation regulator Jag/EloR [Dolosigranulum pigrum]|uniref:RNA-binding cell elongation regulator Jag/EloR n=1 Tax=Dolosigranulum pigrum TaxID=29394 RepID=UPI0019196F56|nr:RNA-binding cell elongation regulator Jag/EloR [Dolosigranulum pigrum]QTJ38893.1 protein jag [Dolosigranulum pigrum]QTJ59247.1 protein jag [Dolosigranulum pigrum]